MPKTHYMQTSFVAGVLDPRLSARSDIRQYYQGMSVGTNVVPVPLGGVKRRPGQRYLGTLLGKLTAVHTSATATAPNGGTAANANDDDWSTAVLTTTDISTTDDYVVVHYDLGSEQSIIAAGVVGLSITSGESNFFTVEYSTDDSSWTNFANNGFMGVIDTVERSYQIIKTAAISARYWRVVRNDTTDLSTARAQLRDLLLWSESTVSESRLFPLDLNDDDDAIVYVASDRTLQAYHTSTLSRDEDLPSPFEDTDLANVDAAQTETFMVTVHEDYEPHLLSFDQSLGQTTISPITFTNIPDYDFNDADSPTPTDDIQSIAFTNFAEGDTFQLELGGARTGPISYQGTGNAENIAATEENIRAAVQKLYTVGFYGVSVAYDASDDAWVITFSEDSADDHALIVGAPLNAASATAAITAEKVQDGVSRREPVWSATRGWPRTVTFHEGRLWFGGSKSLPQSLFGSVVNDFFNFDTGSGLDDDAIFVTMSSSQLNRITGIFSGRDLQIFTTAGEFRIPTSPITPATALPRNQTKYGAAQIKPVSVDGATAFVQKTRKVLRDFLFRYEEDAYSSVPISALAAHLLDDVRDMAAWQGDGDDDSNLIMVVNADGTMAVHATLRSQEIAAWSKWTTDGLYKNVAVSNEERFAIVQRTIDGTAVRFLEHFREDYRLDAAVQSSSTTVVGSVAHLTGETLRVRHGNIILDDQTVSGVSVPLEADGVAYTVAGTKEAGLDWTPIVTTMPLNTDFGNGDNFMRKKRVVKVRANVFETLGIKINGRIIPDDYWDLDNFDEAPEAFTGVHSLEESSNWDEGPLTQTITQEDPLPFHILGLELILETS